MNNSEGRIAIASDHGGFNIKNILAEYLVKKGHKIDDLGTYSSDSVDYPDFAHTIAERIANGVDKRAILICGTGIGMSITANRYPGVRAALGNDIFSARMSRLHNDSNVLVLGGRIVGSELATEIVSTWLDTEFEGGRHNLRIEKIDYDRLETVVYKVVSKYFDKMNDVDLTKVEHLIEEAFEMILKKQTKNKKDK
ncbi:MAG TPA: ribose 5-phosphate isomerase B [Nitrospinota bacterium]|jgi:ribose 5-phosphate isomerase B|nr:ribose 5-phosphate isomerase B [Nitrospinota bacterium]|tara:strand:- start:841 stop:1428 length:588 start_codon:yes stop_codon:yes gene_type:complete